MVVHVLLMLPQMNLIFLEVTSKSLLASHADKRDFKMFGDFVDVRVCRGRAARRALEVEFFTGDVRVRGQRVELSEKERALLFTVAATITISPKRFADALGLTVMAMLPSTRSK
jgi:hypothetical protein